MQYSYIKQLYKFINPKHIIETIESNSIYCPTPDKINDPFDSRVYFSEKPLKKMINMIENEKKPLLAEAQSVIKTINYNYDVFKNVYKNLYTKYGQNFEYSLFKDYGLYSMTIDNDNILMWSHYGDQHKGYCVEWEREEGSIFSDINTCFPVHYSSFLPEYDYGRDDEAEIAKIKASHKYELWAYEKEWRYITKNSNTSIFVSKKIPAVYIGCRANLKTKMNIKVIDLCNQKGINVYQARMDNRRYQIIFDKK